MFGLLAVVAITVVVARNVSFLGFYNESRLTGHDNFSVVCKDLAVVQSCHSFSSRFWFGRECPRLVIELQIPTNRKVLSTSLQSAALTAIRQNEGAHRRSAQTLPSEPRHLPSTSRQERASAATVDRISFALR